MLRLGMACILGLSSLSAHGEELPKSVPSDEGWITNHYGKTLSSLGEIVCVKIEPASQAARPTTNDAALVKLIDPKDKLAVSSTNHLHTAVWRVIEQATLQDNFRTSVPLNIPPVFTVEFADGTRVRASRHTASIRLPDGREGNFVLVEESAKASAAANRDSGEQK